MPSVGGGGHGGGSHGGGSHSHGSSSRVYRGPGYYVGGRYIHIGRGGSLRGNIAGCIFSLVFIIIFSVMVLFALFTTYNDDKFQSYAFEKYDECYQKNEDYEKNILLVVAPSKNISEGYYYISLIGNDIDYTITSFMFGGEGTEYGSTLEKSIPYDYISSNFDEALVVTINHMAERIDKAYSTCYKESVPNTNNNNCNLINEINYLNNFDSTKVLEALDNFKDTTNVSISLVIANYNKFQGAPTFAIIFSIAFISIFYFAMISELIKTCKIVNEFKRAKEKGEEQKYYKNNEDEYNAALKDKSVNNKPVDNLYTIDPDEYNIDKEKFN